MNKIHEGSITQDAWDGLMYLFAFLLWSEASSFIMCLNVCDFLVVKGWFPAKETDVESKSLFDVVHADSEVTRVGRTLRMV